MENRTNPRRSIQSLFDPAIMLPAIGGSFRKLDPKRMISNPVMFVVEIVSLFVTILFLRDFVNRGADMKFTFQIMAWLWVTLLFANFAEAVAEAAARRRRPLCARRASTPRRNVSRRPKLLARAGSGGGLDAGRSRSCRGRDLIPSDGEIIEGVASVDESAITGESAPVIRESGGDRSAVTGGTRVLSDWIKVRITAAHGSTFLDRMIALVEGAQRQKTPNEIALNILLAGLTLIFVFAVATIPSFSNYAGARCPSSSLLRFSSH